MTKKQRAQVVELLRCAADQRIDAIGINGMFDTADALDVSTWLHNLAWDALDTVPYSTVRAVTGLVDEGYRRQLLEAAARVEEGSWP